MLLLLLLLLLLRIGTGFGHGISTGDVHEHGGAALMLGLGLPLKPQRHAVDAGVQRTHHGQRDPEVAELQQEVEDGVLHVLNVARTVRHCSSADKMLPTDD